MLFVEEHGPAPGTVAAAIITSPFHIVAVPKSAGDVVVGGWGSEPDREPRIGRAAGARTSRPSSPATGAPSSTGLEPRTRRRSPTSRGRSPARSSCSPSRTNQDVRFHAWQSIVGLGGLGLAVLASYVLAFVALFVSATVVSVMVGVAYVIWIVLLLVWAICLWQGVVGRTLEAAARRRLRRTFVLSFSPTGLCSPARLTSPCGCAAS